MVGEKAAFVWKTPEGERWIHGIVSRIDQTGRGKKLARYSVRLVPRVWILTLRRQSRIFQNLTTPDILKEVLTSGGIPSDHFKLSLKRSYKPRKYCVQYRETDFDFLSRLMEEEGIFYHFEHTEDGHVMILGDDPVAQVAIAGEATVPFAEESGLVGDEGAGEHVGRFQFGHSVRSGTTTLREFDFKKPTLSLETQSQADTEKRLELYDYPGGYPDTSIGNELVRIRLEEARAVRALGSGEGNCRRFAAGYRFMLDEHWNENLNQEYLLVRVQHWGEQPQAAEEDVAEAAEALTYHNHFECIPAAVTFRPPRITPRPRVEGPQTAVVTGPSGEEIHTDEHGRVKVHFHWDRLGPKDDKSSCWIRVSQGWAGAAWGAMYIPRVGQEVVVEFLEGDPDRPLITGRVYNADNPPPYGLPGEKTKSTLKSKSSPGGGGFNEIRFEDAAGSEEIFVHAQKDQNIVVGNDRTKSVGHDEKVQIKNNRDKSVGVDQSETIGSNKKISVGANHDETIGGNMTLGVTGNEKESIQGNRIVSVGGSHDESIGKNQTETVTINWAKTVGVAAEITVGAALAVSVGANSEEKVGGNKSSSYGGNHEVKVGGSAEEQVSGSKKIGVKGGIQASTDAAMNLLAKDNVAVQGKKVIVKADDEITLMTGSASIVMKKNGDIQIKGKDVKLDGSGKITAKASSDLTLKGSKILQN